MNSNKLTNKM